MCHLYRYDREGFAVNSQSLTETRSAGTGLNMNWKTLSDIKNEDMGHGEKVTSTHANILTYTLHYLISKLSLHAFRFKREIK